MSNDNWIDDTTSWPQQAPGRGMPLSTLRRAEPAHLRREAALLASYAQRSTDSRGQRHPEPPSLHASPYELDRERIVHSAAFRRLSKKLQVFTGNMGDYHRNRLTHTLEVTSLARTVGRALRLNEDLIEALALAHDLGHPPFGHAGEAVLDRCLADVGGYCHNRQGLRLVEELEVCDPRFPGLNLSREVLDGQATRVTGRRDEVPLLEVQVVDAADSITYDLHDTDDALKLGLIAIDELDEVALWREARAHVHATHGALDGLELRQAILQELIGCQARELIEVSRDRLVDIQTPDEARAAGRLIGSSPATCEQKAELERFLMQRVYRHPRVLAMRASAATILEGVFYRLCEHPEHLPATFQARIEIDGPRRTVGDYVAGMTDRFVEEQYHRLAAADPA